MNNNITTAEIGKIFITTNYDELLSHWNRDRQRVNLDKIKRDIKVTGQLVPVTVTRDGIMTDGGHRVQVCKELGIPVSYVRMHYNASAKTMIAINSTQTKWNWRDYITMNIQNKVSGWEDLYLLMMMYEINYTTVVDLGFAPPVAYKKGTPIAVDLAGLEREIEYFLYMIDLIVLIWGNASRKQDVARALCILRNAVNESKILSKMYDYKKNFAKMHKYPAKRMPESTTDHRHWIQDAYNRNRSKANKTKAIAG